MYPELTKNPVFDNFFNITFTYRSSADISWPYGAIVHKNSQKIVKPKELLKPKHIPGQELIHCNLTDFKSRKKDIAWIVSNCKAPSHRDDYVKSMKKVANSSLKIDIFGQCGDLKIHLNEGKKNKTLIDAAYREIAKDYKFYLSFENSLCEDYVTEKFFNALKYGILPITNVKNVVKFAPPHSYLNINDFNSTEDLMKTLENLSRNQELYNSYFWWNEFYRVVDDTQFETQCQFCDILNENGFKSANNYSKFGNYWNKCYQKTTSKQIPP